MSNVPTAHVDSVMQYLGRWQLPLGGLFGISYDPRRDVYYVLNVHESDIGKIRFHSVRLALSSDGIESGQFLGTQTLLDESGYPIRPNDQTLNPPVIAFDAVRDRVYWTSGGCISNGPWMRIAGLDGSYQGEFPGPQRTDVLAGVSLTSDGRYLFAATEQPLGLIRITKFDVETTAAVAQYAYPVERAGPLAGFNRVSDILALSDTSLLVVERTDHLPYAAAVYVYRADVGSASDILAVSSLAGQPVTPMTKSLVIDLNAIPVLRPLANIAGITLGPTLPDGRESVMLVSDNRCVPYDVPQFLAFALWWRG